MPVVSFVFGCPPAGVVRRLHEAGGIADGRSVAAVLAAGATAAQAAARRQGDADGVNLWAGEAHALAQELPAGELVRRLGAQARAALEDARRRIA